VFTKTVPAIPVTGQTYALTRQIPATFADGLVTYIDRAPVDLELAIRQHQGYEHTLRQLGAELIALPPLDQAPDSCFVEDTAVMLDEIGIIARPGTVSRRLETESVEAALAGHRALFGRIEEPGTLEGGDVIVAGRTVYVGLSSRTNQDGIDQLRALIESYECRIVPVQVTGCLHLKTGATLIGSDTVLLNPDWLDTSPFDGLNQISVDPNEPFAANTISLSGRIVMAASAPRTREELERKGFDTLSVDISEMEKLEAGLSCCSIIFGGHEP